MAPDAAPLRQVLIVKADEDGLDAPRPRLRAGLPRGLRVAAVLTGCVFFSGLAARAVLSPASAPLGHTGLYADVVNSSVSYLGCGCFWHVQNMLVTGVEEPIFGRSGSGLTSFTGYAGGSAVGDGGRVCYHNFWDVGDYGELGHAEVASIALPASSARRVFDFFFDTICIGGVRRDWVDAGAEYRSLVGFPGGIDSDLGRTFAQSAQAHGVTVRAGDGNDQDVQGTVFVMDTTRFPFHQAEVYHQFHDDMVEAYGSTYNSMQQQLASSGVLKHTGCPSD